MTPQALIASAITTVFVPFMFWCGGFDFDRRENPFSCAFFSP